MRDGDILGVIGRNGSGKSTLLDEVLGVGDVGFLAKSRAKLEDMMEQAHAIVVVSHSMTFVREACTKALWLSDGRIEAFGDPRDVVKRYLASTSENLAPVR